MTIFFSSVFNFSLLYSVIHILKSFYSVLTFFSLKRLCTQIKKGTLFSIWKYSNWISFRFLLKQKVFTSDTSFWNVLNFASSFSLSLLSFSNFSNLSATWMTASREIFANFDFLWTSVLSRSFSDCSLRTASILEPFSRSSFKPSIWRALEICLKEDNCLVCLLYENFYIFPSTIYSCRERYAVFYFFSVDTFLFTQ